MCRQSHLREKMQNKTIRFKDDGIEFNLNTKGFFSTENKLHIFIE